MNIFFSLQQNSITHELHQHRKGMLPPAFAATGDTDQTVTLQ